MNDTRLLHIAHATDLATADAAGTYRAASLDTEGFLHCCYAHQLSGVISRWFKGAEDLYLLTIDPTQLTVPPVLENTSGGEELFPHVYGDIPLAAITAREALA
jgi:uncharacterized protein (DUF952 family)